MRDAATAGLLQEELTQLLEDRQTLSDVSEEEDMLRRWLAEGLTWAGSEVTEVGWSLTGTEAGQLDAPGGESDALSSHTHALPHQIIKARSKKKEDDTYLPVNLERLIWTAQRNERINTDKSLSDLDPKEVSHHDHASYGCKKGLS